MGDLAPFEEPLHEEFVRQLRGEIGDHPNHRPVTIKDRVGRRIPRELREKMLAILSRDQRLIEECWDKADSFSECLLAIHCHSYFPFLCQETALWEQVYIDQNVPIEAPNGKFYRPDIHMVVCINGTMLKVIAECDGPKHLDPDRSKHDKERDRNLTSMGYKIFRFTAGEIRRDGVRCVLELRDAIERLAEQDVLAG